MTFQMGLPRNGLVLIMICQYIYKKLIWTYFLIRIKETVCRDIL
jgi:hypothetical protein